MPRTATVPVCSRCTTSTTCATPTARTTNALEAFQVISCMDTVERPTVERGGCQRRRSSSRSTSIRDRDRRQLLLHVLPADDRPAHRDHRARGPGRSWWWAPPATRRRRWRAPARWRQRSSRGGSCRRRQPTHRLRLNECSSAAVDDYLVDPVGPAEPAYPDGRVRYASDRARSCWARDRLWCPRRIWRKEWDSNPRRPIRPQRCSRPSHSSTLASFRVAG